MNRVILVLGGARSGKSRLAESLARNVEGPSTYIATAEITDEDMQARVAKHVVQRGSGWVTVEAPLDLAGAIAAATPGFVLVECVTVWINNLMHYGHDVEGEVERLCGALPRYGGTIVLVSNEVGLGIIPGNELARRFCDAAGRANQRLAGLADEVHLVAAGIPLRLKPQR